MEENFKNTFGFFAFTFIVLALAIGGFIFTKYILNDAKENKVNNKVISYKIDKDKDYFYYTNESTISEGAEIFYKDIVINLNTQETLNESLNKENALYKNNIKYLDDANLPTEEIINYRNDNLYALTFREYETYETDEYASLVIKDYNYSCFDLVTFYKTKSYIFDLSNGKLLKEEEILNKYDITIDDIKNEIREYLNNNQKQNDEGNNVIKIDETLNNFDNYSLYINNYGRLYISFLVKSIDNDYNESMEV